MKRPMNFWEFLDKNIEALLVAFILFLVVATPIIGAVLASIFK